MTQGRRRRANPAPTGLEADAPLGHPIHGRDRFHPVRDQSPKRDNVEAGRETTDASAFAIRARMLLRPPQGLITDGVETIPTKGGDRTLLSRF